MVQTAPEYDFPDFDILAYDVFSQYLSIPTNENAHPLSDHFPSLFLFVQSTTWILKKRTVVLVIRVFSSYPWFMVNFDHFCEPQKERK